MVVMPTNNWMDSYLYILSPLLIACLVFFVTFQLYRRHAPLDSPSNSDDQDDESGDLSSELQEEEKELIQNIREFRDGIVREVMIPRIDMIAVDENTSLEAFRQLALEKGHSRIPVYRDSVDHIVGVAYVKDMLRYWGSSDAGMTVTTFMRPPYFVPETKNIGALLHEFQIKKVHIAVAIDEYGGTAGIVTIEDLLEVVFGEIVDEHDEEEELITVVDEHTIEVNAKADIDDLQEYVGEIVVEHQDFETVGGLLFAILGEIPQENEVVEYQNLKFTIVKADRHRILQVKVEHDSQTINA